MLAIVWLGEALTLLRIVGIILVVLGPGFTLGPDEKPAAKIAAPDAADGISPFNPQYREGYFYALLSAVGFGISPIFIAMAFETKGLAVGIAGGFVSYVAATVFIGLPLLVPGEWRSFRAVGGESAKWFLISGVSVGPSQMFRYMALAISPVSVAAPIMRLSLVFRIYFGAMLNPHHEVFGGRLIAGTVISLADA